MTDGSDAASSMVSTCPPAGEQMSMGIPKQCSDSSFSCRLFHDVRPTVYAVEPERG